jgi:hypothetical protein
MDLTLHEAIDETRRALDLALVVGAWSDAARLAERLAVYCELAERADVASER